MKTTGLIRRIDDRGRVAIPDEIRREYHIREGDPLEFFIDQMDGQPVICFRKYGADFLNSFTILADTICEEMNDQWWSKRDEVCKHFDAITELLKEFEGL